MAAKEHVHPAVQDLKNQLDKAKITRREFMRYAALLGVSTAAAGQMIGLLWPQKTGAASVKRGGTLKISQQIQKIDHRPVFPGCSRQIPCAWFSST